MDSTTLRRSDEGREESLLQTLQKQKTPSNAQAQRQECVPLTDAANSATSHGSKARLLSPFAVPSKRFYGSRTRLVHGRVMVVDVPGKFLVNNTKKIYFDLQDKHDSALRFPVLMAVKHWMNIKFDIYDISWDDDDHAIDDTNKSGVKVNQQDATNNDNNKVGTLKKMLLPCHIGKITYKLCNNSGAEEARISYKLHNPVMDKIVTPGRQCELVLLTDEGKKKLITSNDIEEEVKKQKVNGDTLDNKPNTNYNNMDDEQPKDQLLHRLVSKIPETRNADQQFALDFKGRGRQTSNKNAQLVLQDKNGGMVVDLVVMQMAKVEDGIFHVDYRAPCTAFQAFAYALAQLDL
jgi:Tub family